MEQCIHILANICFNTYTVHTLPQTESVTFTKRAIQSLKSADI